MGPEQAGKIALGLQFGSIAAQTMQARSAARFNEAAARQEAESIRAQTKVREEEARAEARQLLARQRVMAAKSGVEAGAGSPLLVMLDTVRQSELDIQNLIWSGEMAARSKELAARLERYKGKSALLSGALGAGAVIAGGFERGLFGKSNISTEKPTEKPRGYSKGRKQPFQIFERKRTQPLHTPPEPGPPTKILT